MAMFKCVGALFDGTINVNTVAGSTVTATTSATAQVFQAVADVTGLAVIKVKKKGTYAIASTGTARLGHAVVNDRTPVTAYYEWQKWDSQQYYYQSNTTKYYNPNTFWGGSYLGWKSYCAATSYSFDENTGQYVLSNGYLNTHNTQSVLIPAYIRSSNARKYFSHPAQGGTNVTNMMGELAGYTGTSASDVYANISYYYWESSAYPSNYVNEWQAGQTYRKGSTQYENATGTTLDALPADGRNTEDGYWYIAS